MSNATITVAYEGRSVDIELDGTELSEVIQRDRTAYYYLTNASKGFITDKVEDALRELRVAPS